MATWLIVLAALYGLVYFFKSAPKDDKRAVKWSALESVGVGVFIYFGSQLLGGLIAYGLAVLTGQNPETAFDWLQDTNIGQFLLILMIEAVTGYLLLTFMKRRLTPLKAIGLFGRPGWRDFGYVVFGFVIYFVLFVLAVTLLENNAPGLVDVDQEQQIGFSNPASWQLPLVFISLVLLPAIFEEIVVRGFVYTGLKQGVGKRWAAFVASFLFAIAHLQAWSGEPLLWIAALDTFVLSLVLIYIKEKTGGKLWAPIGLHMVKNSIAFYSLYLASMHLHV